MPGQPDTAASRPAPPDDARPKNRETEYEDYKVPGKAGQPPRSASEPPQSEGSAKNPHTATDPVSGEPQGHPADPTPVGSQGDDEAERRP